MKDKLLTIQYYLNLAQEKEAAERKAGVYYSELQSRAYKLREALHKATLKLNDPENELSVLVAFLTKENLDDVLNANQEEVIEILRKFADGETVNNPFKDTKGGIGIIGKAKTFLTGNVCGLVSTGNEVIDVWTDKVVKWFKKNNIVLNKDTSVAAFNASYSKFLKGNTETVPDTNSAHIYDAIQQRHFTK